MIKSHLGHDVKDSYSVLKKESTNNLIDASIVSIDLSINSYKAQKDSIIKYSRFHLRNIKANEKKTIKFIKRNTT